MFDFLGKNIEINLLLLFLVITIICFFLIKHEYIKNKILGWIYIITLLLFCFIIPYGSYVLSGIILLLSIYEFRKLLVFGKIKNIILSIIGLFILGIFLIYIIENFSQFIYIFICIAFSDIVAYFTGKIIIWKKGFTNLSPNKTLSGVIGQILFLSVCLIIIFDFNIFLGIIISTLAPIGDLCESFFKRKAKIKDTAYYIPGHGGILDRLDSSLLVINFIFILSL